MNQVKIYETQVIGIALTDDYETVVMTFKPINDNPVSINIPRSSFCRFLNRATEVLSDSEKR